MWEYKIVGLNLLNDSHKLIAEAEMNRLGTEEWELIKVTSTYEGDYGTHTLFFKRPRKEQDGA